MSPSRADYELTALGSSRLAVSPRKHRQFMLTWVNRPHDRSRQPRKWRPQGLGRKLSVLLARCERHVAARLGCPFAYLPSTALAVPLCN